MKKKLARKHRARTRTPHHYITIVRGWMFLVAFALMLGLGAMVGNALNNYLNASTPQVAGAQTELR